MELTTCTVRSISVFAICLCVSVFVEAHLADVNDFSKPLEMLSVVEKSLPKKKVLPKLKELI